MANHHKDRESAALAAFEALVRQDRPGSPEDKHRKREHLKYTPYGKPDQYLSQDWLEARQHSLFWLRHFIDG